MKNNILNTVSILLCIIIISAGYTYFYYRGEAVFNIMYAAISTLLALKPFICPQCTNDSSRDKKQLDRHPIQKEKKCKK